MTSFFVGERGKFVSDRDSEVNVNKCRSSTVRFDSADPCNRRDHYQIVRIGVLEVYRLLSSTALFSYKVALDEKDDRVA